MTNADLELARQSVQGVPWQYDEMHRFVYDPRDGSGFAPKADHFADVLAWLIKTGCVSLHGECIVGKELHVDFPAHDEEPLIIKLDGTSTGIKQAVYEAAIRVIKEQANG